MTSFYDVFIKNLSVLQEALQREIDLVPSDIIDTIEEHGKFLDKKTIRG